MAANPSSLPPRALDATQLKQRLELVRTELKRTQDEIQADAASLERLRSLLDVGYWNDLQGVVNTLEARAREAIELAQAAEATNQELRRRMDQEASRLEKLWDAFKVQEDELRSTRERAERLDRELGAQDASRARLASEVEERDSHLRRVSDERDTLLVQVDELEGKMDQLRDVEALRAEATGFKSKYEAERDRLAKLYALYEESEGDRAKLREELGFAEQWFEDNRECVEKLARSLRWRSDILKRREASGA